MAEQKRAEPKNSDQKRTRRAIMSLVNREHSSFEPLSGREKEHEQIRAFVVRQLKNKQGSSIYVCGSPGTGKSVTMRAISGWFAKKRQLVWINGMSISNPAAIYQVLYAELLGDASKMQPLDAKDKLERYLFEKRKAMLMLVVDEMDGLLSTSKRVALYHLFDWTKRPGCRLILIGIANSIDLTERFLPRLKTRGIEPELLIFKPYSKPQLVHILHDVLGAESGELVDRVALSLCAQKVAKIGGDARQCLQLLLKALQSVVHTESQRVGFEEMNAVLRNAFRSPLADKISKLPQQQKTVLVIASILDGASKGNMFSLGKLERFVQWFSEKRTLPRTSAPELTIIIDSFICDSIMRVVNQKSRSKKGLVHNTQLQLMAARDDVEFAVSDDKQGRALLESNAAVPPRFLD